MQEPDLASVEPSHRKPRSRPRVLILIEYFLPGFRGGGPVRSLANLVEALGDEIEFRAVTSDRDLGECVVYPGADARMWVRRRSAWCLHLPRGWRDAARLCQVLRRTPHDTMYLNSIFSRRFSIAPLVLWRLGLVPDVRVVVAPRGELVPGALSLHATRKRIFLRAAAALGMYARVCWHASTPQEAAEIRRWFGADAHVHVAANVAILPTSVASSPGDATKRAGRLRLVFYSRVVPVKNLLGALDLVRHLRGAVTLDIRGPIEDRAYWRRCEAAIRRLPGNIEVRHRGVVPFGAAESVLASYDALLLPTLGENFGHAILEALAAGCPALVSDATPWRDLEPHRAGWAIPLEASERWMAALETCLEMGPAEHERWMAGAREYARRVTSDPAALEGHRELFAASGP